MVGVHFFNPVAQLPLVEVVRGEATRAEEIGKACAFVSVRPSQSFHVVDLDHYQLGAFSNEMGRMFGSSRFMAPEEFELPADPAG